MAASKKPPTKVIPIMESTQKQSALTETIPSKRVSAFTELGFKQTIAQLQEEIRELYLADDVPWIIGYSGGKDSTATLQLVWTALSTLEPAQRSKVVHVISTDTLVENPVVSAWVSTSLRTMKEAAEVQGVPVAPNLLHPRLEDSFWVNLIGRGYPAPRPKFRWCTERLKIRPSNAFITDIVTKNGEAILCLGVRKQESIVRARALERHAKYRVRDRLSPSASLPGCQIYSPVEDWTSDDIWFYLTSQKNPWGASNKDLMGMYAGASADGECPLVVDSSTPSCGDSRFGCWVCTLVEQDKSMTAMIQNDVEKEWMMPLLDLRNALDFRNNGDGDEEASDRHLRDFRRMTGGVQLMPGGRYVPGPYTQQARADWLTKLLRAQTYIRQNGPADVANIELITLDELQEIRRIWVIDKHELEDILPGLYEEATGLSYPGQALDDNLVLGSTEMKMLEELCGDDRMHYELARELLSVTRQQRSMGRRAGLYEQMEKTFRRHFYDDKEDAVNRMRRIAEEKERLQASRSREGISIQPDLLGTTESE